MESKNAETPELKKEDLEEASGGKKIYSYTYGGYLICEGCGGKDFEDAGFVFDGPNDGHFDYRCTNCGKILHYKQSRCYYF